jgi:acyl-CoA synthetase (AMP-forming)/AMP-acid ligase II
MSSMLRTAAGAVFIQILMATEMLLISSLRRAAQINPNGMAVTGTHSLTWRAFVDGVARVASGLRRIGIEPGDRVAILSLNRFEFLELQYAVLWSGAVLVPVNHRLNTIEMGYVLADAQVALLAVDSEFIERGAVLTQDSGMQLLSMETGTTAAGLTQDQLRDSQAMPALEHQHDDTGLTAIFYTGGTTGHPKGVMLSDRAFAFQSVAMMSALAFRPDSIYLHATPMFHLADYGIGLALTLATGTHAFLPKFSPALAMDGIANHRATDINLVPTMLAAILDQADAGQLAALSSVRTFAYGGAPMPEALLRKLMTRLPHAQFRQFYGMTELCGACTSLAPEWHAVDGLAATHLRSAGKNLSFIELAIVDADGRHLGPDLPGEIIVRGPQVMLGYWNNPQASAAAIKDGWMHTGDIGKISGDGFLSVVDRLKDMIVTGGENVYSVEVEDILMRHPGVAACAVIGVPDEYWGERVHAVLVSKQGVTLQVDEVDAFCRDHIAGYKRPRSYEIRTEMFALSGAGKIQKAELRKDALART